jgi:hypothetical protein
MVAVGVPGWPTPSTSWDWWSLVGIVVVCVVATRWLGLRLGFPLLAVAVCLGPIIAMIVHRHGVIAGSGWIVLLAIAASLIRRFVVSVRRPPTV